MKLFFRMENNYSLLGSTQTVIPFSSTVHVQFSVDPFSKPSKSIKVIGMVVLSDLPVVFALFTLVLNFITLIPPVIKFVVFKFTSIVMTMLVFKVTSFLVFLVT